MMKKTAAMMLSLALMAAFAGCAPQAKPAPTPSPAVITPVPSPAAAPEATSSPAAAPNTPGDAGGAIEGFKEGELVDAEKLPDKVKAAIKEKYPEATIKSVTFATYENKQLYKVLLQKTETDATEEVYAAADGTIIPAKAAPADTKAPEKKK